jgi:hypothetical protein
VIHPFLLAIFPILGLFAQNSLQVPLGHLWAPLVLGLAASLTVWLVAIGVLRDARRAGVFTTLGLVPFWLGSRFPQDLDSTLTMLSGQWVRTDVHIPPSVSVLVAAVLLAMVGLALAARLRSPGTWTRILNVFSIALLMLPISEILRTKWRRNPEPPQRTARVLPVTPEIDSLPDIYYLILDGYARSDVMKDLYNFDNSPFLSHLERQGFFVAHDSTANYCQTPLSLSSSLNFEYLDGLVKGLDSDLTALREVIGRNNLIATLRPLGYMHVSFSTGFEPTDYPDADRYLSPYPQFAEFQRYLIDRTPLWPFFFRDGDRDLFAQSRDRTLYTLDQLAEISTDPRPTLTFAHIVCPHPPFLFGENGEDTSQRDNRYDVSDGVRYQALGLKPEAYVRGYRDQAVYITRRIEQVIDQILAQSKEPPILIIQSDHGPGLRLDMENREKTDLHERMSILNAYYFPGHRYQELYPKITPVNSFRVVLNTFFGANLELLPDKNYFSTWAKPYQFMDVTEAINHPSPSTARPLNPKSTREDRSTPTTTSRTR